MKKTALTAALALALTAGLSAPAQADSKHKQWAPILTPSIEAIDDFVIEPVRHLIGLLLPAVQKVRE